MVRRSRRVVLGIIGVCLLALTIWLLGVVVVAQVCTRKRQRPRLLRSAR